MRQLDNTIARSTASPGGPPAAMPRWLRAARVIHPFPTLLNVAATAGLAFVAAEGAPDGSTLARMLAVMLLAQSAIGVTNDIFDRDLDAAAKPWKPIPSGAVSLRTAAGLALAFMAGAVIFASTLGVASFALAMLGMCCGLAYDVRLKRTLLSAVPFMLAIPTLPSWIWVTLDEWEDVLWWLWPIGALMVLAIHLANTLPDIDDDVRHGVRGMPHYLGAGRSRALSWAAFAIALGLAAIVGVAADADDALLVIALAVGAFALAAAIGTYSVRRDGLADQVGFGLMGIGAAVAATGWLAAVA